MTLYREFLFFRKVDGRSSKLRFETVLVTFQGSNVHNEWVGRL